MIARAGRWTRTPSATHLQPKNEMLIFGLCSTSDDQPGWSMDSNPICHPSPAKNMKCLFLDYLQLLMIGRAGRWTWTPSTTSLQPKKWNAHFWITFNFWWLAGLVDGLEPHLPPLSSQKKLKCSFLGYVQLLMISQAGRWTWTPSATHLQPKKTKCSFLDYIQLLMIARAYQLTRTPSTTPLQPKKMKCSFLEYVQLLMISLAGQWTWTPSATSLQPKKWNAHFWITFNSWWLAGLVDGLEPHLPPLSSHKNEMLIFGLCSTSDDQLDWSLDSNSIHHPSPAKNMKCLFLDNVQLLMISQGGRWTRAPSAIPLQPKKMKCSFLDYVQLLMISPAGQWTQIPSATSLQPKKWNVHFWIMFNFWWSARLVNGLKSHLPPLSSQKNEMFIFGLHSTSDDWSDWLMDSNPIHHPSLAKKMKCSFLGYVQLLMISQAGQWTRTPSATRLQPKTWNACFWITFNFWCSAGLVNGLECHPPPLSSQKKLNAHFKIMFNFWRLAGLVNGLKPHLPPLSSQKNEMLVFGLHSTSDDQLGWSMDSNSICNPYPAKKNEMLIFGLRSTSDDQLDWSMDSNAIHHPSPAKNMKCLFLDYIQLLMICQAGRCTRTPFATSLQPKKWNPHFWITFKSWWSAGLVNGLEPHLPPLSSQKNEMLIFGLCSTSDDWPGWSMDLSPVCHLSAAKKMKCSFLGYIQLLMIAGADQLTQTPSTTPQHPKKMKCPFLDYIQILMISQVGPWTRTAPATHLQPKKWNPHFWNTFNSWWSAGLVDGLEPHLPRLSSQKHEILIFGFHWTSDDWPGWSMDLNPIYHLSPAKKMKCSFLDYVQLLMIGRAGRWTWALCATSLQPKKWNAHFWVTFNFWWSARLVDGLEPHLQPLSSQKKLNALFWITFNFWWLPGLINWLELHPPPLSSQKNEMSIFRLQSNSDDKPGWSMDSNPICHLSPAKKNEMLIFGICSTSDDQPGWSMDLNPICHLSPAKKMKCSFLDYIQLLMIGRAGRWTWTPSTTSLQPQKWNAHFWITFNFWWSAGLVNGLECHPPPLSSQKHEMLVFG